MGLDATIYTDDNNDAKIDTMRIGNIANVAHLRDSIRGTLPDANVLLTQVLHTGTHCGDSLQKEDIVRAKIEVENLLERSLDDEFAITFAAGFGKLLGTALQHNRPVVFT